MKIICSVISLSFMVLLLLVTPVIGSDDWVEYGRSKIGDIYSYNKGNIEHRSKYIVQVWDKQVYSEKGREKNIQDTIDFVSDEKMKWEKIEYVKSSYEINCKNKRIREMSYVFFDIDGNTGYSRSYDQPKWVSIPLDTMWDNLRKNVCK